MFKEITLETIARSALSPSDEVTLTSTLPCSKGSKPRPMAIVLSSATFNEYTFVLVVPATAGAAKSVPETAISIV